MDVGRRIADAERQRRIRIIDESFADQSRRIQGLDDFITDGKQGDGGKLSTRQRTRPITRPRPSNLSDGLTGGLNSRGRSLGGRISPSAVNQHRGQTITVNATEVITNQTSRNVGKQVGKQTVGKIIKGASVIGKLQNAWDLGTGIGGLGRGLLGLDDINPYQDIPGFGSAELAWDLGDWLVDELNELIDVNDLEDEESQQTINSSVQTTLSERENLPYVPVDPVTITPTPIIDISYSGQSFNCLIEFTYTTTSDYWSMLSDKYYQSQSSGTESEFKIEVRLQGINPKKKPSQAGDAVLESGANGGILSVNQLYGLYLYGSGYDSVQVYEKKKYRQGVSYNAKGESFNAFYTTNFPYPYDTGDFVRKGLSFSDLFFSSFQNLDGFAHSPKKSSNIVRSPAGIQYFPIYLSKERLYDRWSNTMFNELNVYYNNRETVQISDFKFTVLDKPRKSISLGYKNMADCKALDAFKAMEARVNALEAHFNAKLGENIEKIEITTIDENGEEIKEEIELDGIGGTVSKILENQYKQNENDNEEILKRLGDPIDIETELPTGETLAAAGIGIGGLAGLALLSQKKLGKSITKLPIYSNGGTPTNIIPNLTEADTDGIGGGIDRINQEMQSGKHENDKKTKLDLRANLIDLLNLALNLHNAFSLSSTLLQTIVSFMNNVFSIFGLKDKDGNDINIAELMGDTIQGILNTLIGTDNTTELIAFLKKSNRIIQTGSNILFDLQGLTDSVRSISQQTGEYVAKIGNALRRNRIVPDDPQDSYQWMDEKMTPTSAFQKRIESISEELNNVTDFMGSLESVTSEVISAQEQFVSLKNNSIEFKNLVIGGENAKSEEEGVNTNKSQAEGDMSTLKPQAQPAEEP